MELPCGPSGSDSVLPLHGLDLWTGYYDPTCWVTRKEEKKEYTTIQHILIWSSVNFLRQSNNNHPPPPPKNTRHLSASSPSMCLIYVAEMQVVEPLWGTTIAHRAIPAHCSDSGWWVVVGVRSGGRGSSSGGIGCLCKLSCLPKTMSTWVCAGALHWPWMGLWVFSFIRFRWSHLGAGRIGVFSGPDFLPTSF